MAVHLPRASQGFNLSLQSVSRRVVSLDDSRDKATAAGKLPVARAKCGVSRELNALSQLELTSGSKRFFKSLEHSELRPQRVTRSEAARERCEFALKLPTAVRVDSLEGKRPDASLYRVRELPAAHDCATGFHPRLSSHRRPTQSPVSEVRHSATAATSRRTSRRTPGSRRLGFGRCPVGTQAKGEQHSSPLVPSGNVLSWMWGNPLSAGVAMTGP